MPSKTKSNYCPQIIYLCSSHLPKVKSSGPCERECVWGVGGGPNHTAPSIAQPGNGASEPAKDGDVGCAKEANACFPLPQSRVGGGGEGKANSGTFKCYQISF